MAYNIALFIVLTWLPIAVYYFIPSDDLGYMR